MINSINLRLTTHFIVSPKNQDPREGIQHNRCFILSQTDSTTIKLVCDVKSYFMCYQYICGKNPFTYEKERGRSVFLAKH